MADKDWLSAFTGTDPIQDPTPITNVMPDLDEPSAPGAGDGDTALSVHVEVLRDKLDSLCKLTGDSLSDPAGSICKILDRNHSTGDAEWLRLGERTAAPTGVAGKVYLYALDDSGTTKAYIKWSDDTEVELGTGGSGGLTNTVVGSSGITNVGTNEDADLAPTYGSSANTVCQGNDARLSDARTPTGAASGDLTGTYPGPTVDAGAIDNTKLADMAQATLKGRAAAAGTGDPTDLTGTQATAILDVFTSGLKGLVPASGGGGSVYLNADGGFTTPSGGGGGGFDREEEFVASASPQETFTLAASAAVNANTPSGYSVRVYVNGLKHAHNASPGAREFDIIAANQIRVGGLNISDDVEIVYGV